MGMGGASLESVDFLTPKDKRGELADKMHAELTQIDTQAGHSGEELYRTSVLPE